MDPSFGFIVASLCDAGKAGVVLLQRVVTGCLLACPAGPSCGALAVPFCLPKQPFYLTTAQFWLRLSAVLHCTALLGCRGAPLEGGEAATLAELSVFPGDEIKVVGGGCGGWLGGVGWGGWAERMGGIVDGVGWLELVWVGA